MVPECTGGPGGGGGGAAFVVAGGGAGSLVVVTGAAAVRTGAAGVLTTGAGVGDSDGLTDADGLGILLADDVVATGAAGLPLSDPPVYAAIAVPPQHSTRNAETMTMMSVLRLSFFCGTAGYGAVGGPMNGGPLGRLGGPAYGSCGGT
jgi:hypothetical protein